MNPLSLSMHLKGSSFTWEVSHVSWHRNCPALLWGVEDRASGKEELHHQDRKSFVMVSGNQDMYNVCSSRNLRPKISDTVNSYHPAMKNIQCEKYRARMEVLSRAPRSSARDGIWTSKTVRTDSTQRCCSGLGELA